MKIGRYEVVRRLGSGGMGEVLLGRLAGEEGFVTYFALKRLKPDRSAMEAGDKDLIREARIGGLLNHANVVRIHELLRVEGEFVLVMEYVDGTDLETILDHQWKVQQPLSPHLAVEILIQVAEGLHHAHTLVDPEGNSHPLVHRDLKPANVRLSRGGAIKVMDFGIARDQTSDTRTLAGHLKGTVRYMSPEQAAGSENVGFSTDIYACGAILFEMLALRPLHPDLPFVELVHRVQDGIIEDRLEMLPDLPDDLWRILRRCLARRPQDRYPSALDLSEALRHCRGAMPTGESLARFAERIDQAIRSGERNGAGVREIAGGEEALSEFINPPTAMVLKALPPQPEELVGNGAEEASWVEETSPWAVQSLTGLMGGPSARSGASSSDVEVPLPVLPATTPLPGIRPLEAPPSSLAWGRRSPASPPVEVAATAGMGVSPAPAATEPSPGRNTPLPSPAAGAPVPTPSRKDRPASGGRPGGEWAALPAMDPWGLQEEGPVMAPVIREDVDTAPGLQAGVMMSKVSSPALRVPPSLPLPPPPPKQVVPRPVETVALPRSMAGTPAAPSPVAPRPVETVALPPLQAERKGGEHRKGGSAPGDATLKVGAPPSRSSSAPVSPSSTFRAKAVSSGHWEEDVDWKPPPIQGRSRAGVWMALAVVSVVVMGWALLRTPSPKEEQGLPPSSSGKGEIAAAGPPLEATVAENPPPEKSPDSTKTERIQLAPVRSAESGDKKEEAPTKVTAAPSKDKEKPSSASSREEEKASEEPKPAPSLPRIIHTPPGSAVAGGQPLAFSVTVPERSGCQVKVVYRVGSGGWKDLRLPPAGGGEYWGSLKVTASMVDGLSYYVKVTGCGEGTAGSSSAPYRVPVL